ncbi:MAG: carboxypeptidase regulatory-like domain-containing protein [Pyrinomonadaceae bacterium]
MPLIILLVLTFASLQCEAQPDLNVWSSNGPKAYITNVVGDPFNVNIVYAASPDGIFKSVNNGVTWFIVNQTDAFDVEADFVNPNTFYATNSLGVLKSTDGGANWSSLNSTGGDRLAVARSDPNFIYTTTNAGIRVTTNGGASWNTHAFPVAYEYVSVFEVDPQNPNVIYAFLGDFDFLLDLYKSTDGGLSWVQLFYGGGYHVSTTALKIDPANPDIIYTSTYFGVYKSTNGGASWTLRGTVCFPGVPCDPPTALYLAIDPLAPATLYTIRSNGPYKSLDDGVTFSSFNNGFADVFVNGLAFEQTGKFLYAATPSGVFSVRIRENAPSVSVSGRVVTSTGQGIANALVRLTDSTGVRRNVRTSSFGFYAFDDVRRDEMILLGVSSKQYRFTSRSLFVNGNIQNGDFVGLE